MRILLTLTALAAMGWSGYWFFGKAGVSDGFESWFQERQTEGWVAEYSNLETKGFPSRFDTTITDLSLADPDTGLAWEAPFFQLLALSYKPNHLIAVWPNEQLLATPAEKYSVESTDMKASFVTAADIRLPLERGNLTASAMRIKPASSDQATSIDALRIAIERRAPTTSSYRFGFAADGFSPTLDWRARLDPAGKLPDSFDALTADITVDFDKPWDRSAIEVARPQPTRIDIKLAEARWGRLELQVAGEVDVDAEGYPDGSITVKARNWRDILKMAVASGTLGEGIAGTLESGLGLISQIAGNPETLDIPLGFSGGYIKLGPIPFGPAPKLRLR